MLKAITSLAQQGTRGPGKKRTRGLEADVDGTGRAAVLFTVEMALLWPPTCPVRAGTCWLHLKVYPLSLTAVHISIDEAVL